MMPNSQQQGQPPTGGAPQGQPQAMPGAGQDPVALLKQAAMLILQAIKAISTEEQGEGEGSGAPVIQKPPMGGMPPQKNGGMMGSLTGGQ